MQSATLKCDGATVSSNCDAIQFVCFCCQLC